MDRFAKGLKHILYEPRSTARNVNDDNHRPPQAGQKYYDQFRASFDVVDE